MHRFEIIWSAPEYEHRPKDAGWYWWSIIIAVIVLSIAVWQRNFLFAFIIIMAEMLVIVWANREPSLVDFAVDQRGLHIHPRGFYPHAHITSFSFIEHDHSEWADVVFYLDKRFQNKVRVHFPKRRLKELHATLGDIMPLVVHEESLLDSIERYLGF